MSSSPCDIPEYRFPVASVGQTPDRYDRAVERRDVRLLTILAVLSGALLLAFAAGAVGGVVLFAAPVALLAVPLLSGRYVGEESIQRLAARQGHRARRSVRSATPARRGPARAFPRGGLLVAASLAERGPPRSALVS